MPRAPELPDVRSFGSLIDILDDAVARHGDAEALGLRRDDDTAEMWSYHDLRRRAWLAAWRLRHELGLQPGDRLLTWSPSTPELPAVYFGAMRAGVIFVPLDLRMSADAVTRIAERSGATALAVGTGRDAPDPREAGLTHLPARTVADLAAEPGDPATAEAWFTEVEGWPRPARPDVFEVIYTSGTTGTPKGVMLTHGGLLAAIEGAHHIIAPQEHRVVSLLPLSHLLEQMAALYYALSVGASILYVRSRNPRVIFEAIRSHRVTTMVVVPQVLDLFWSAIEREVDQRGRRRLFGLLRRLARRLPYRARRLLFRSFHRQFGGGLNLFICSAAFLPPALQQAWEDLGVVVMQGYGSTEAGLATCTTKADHGLGTVGRPIPPNEVRLAEDGEIHVRGPGVTPGYWQDPETTAAAFDTDGWYHTGDVGRFDQAGHLVLAGRKKNMIVLPNGFNVYPEDIENALRIAGIRESVVLETAPGRIEAIVLTPDGGGIPQSGEVRPGQPLDPATAVALRERIDAAVKAANRTLGINQRVAAWRLWPDADFPRTHTLKVKRDVMRAWVAADAAPVETAR